MWTAQEIAEWNDGHIRRSRLHQPLHQPAYLRRTLRGIQEVSENYTETRIRMTAAMTNERSWRVRTVVLVRTRKTNVILRKNLTNSVRKTNFDATRSAFVPRCLIVAYTDCEKFEAPSRVAARSHARLFVKKTWSKHKNDNGQTHSAHSCAAAILFCNNQHQYAQLTYFVANIKTLTDLMTFVDICRYFTL